MPGLQFKRNAAGTGMAGDGQDHNIDYEAPKTEIMKNSWKSRSGEIRIRSGHISHGPERLQIDQ